MRFNRVALALAGLGISVISCNDGPTIPKSPLAPLAANMDAATQTGVVISQVYGGGGNAGSVFKNDFIELFNPGATAVSLAGWSVQYGSATGTTWQKTNLTGSIAPGGYYLVQEAVGAGGTTPLPTPNDIGTTAMAAGAGKVALVNNQTLLSGCTPTAAGVIDLVGYGTGSSGANCFEGTAAAPTITNTTADLRKMDGAQDTDQNSADFATGTPNPRNGNGGGVTVGPLDHVNVAGATSVPVNGNITFTASLQDAANQSISDASATYVWTSGDPATLVFVSQTNNTATFKALQVGGPVSVSVDATSNAVTKTGTSAGVTVTQPVIGHVTIGSGTTPLVIGYQTQLFVNGGSTDQAGNPVTSANVTWSSSNPAIMAIDSRGVVTAAGDGSAVLTATASDGVSKGSLTLPSEVPLYNANARVGHNTEFGLPTDADPSNDVIIAREEYTISYNPQRGGPNWVSWDISKSHLGTRDRCNCYSADTAIARLGYSQFMYTTADYTGGGYDRGHMEPSADQTVTDGENARTFFLSNFLPQVHVLNAGPWERLETALRDSVNAGREAYVIAGGLFANGTGVGSLKNEGKIFIPNSTWKIAVIVPANTGLGEVTKASDMTVIAVNMVNDSTFAYPSDWNSPTYRTTVQALQQATGYNFLSALPEAIQCRVEQRDCAPAAHISGATTGNEGSTLSFDASTSSDPDGDALSYEWSVNGATAGIQPALSYTFADNGNYTLRLIVSDASGKGDTTTATVSIANVAPSLGFSAPASVNEADAIQLVTSSPTDPSSVDVAAGLKIEVDCGAGQGYVVIAAAGTTSCPTTDNGTRTVRARITDKDNGVSEYVKTVNVLNVAPATTFSAVLPLHIVSGLIATVKGGFTDPGADSPWNYAIDWKDGSAKTGTFTSSGSSTLQVHQYLKAGTYTVPFSVTDKDGGVGTSTVVVQVDRVPVEGDINPSSIKLNDNGNGNITVKLSSLLFLVTDVNVSTIRIGSVAPTKSHTENGGNRYSLDFSRKALIDAGVLTTETRSVTVTADLTNGVQIQAVIPVSVH